MVVGGKAHPDNREELAWIPGVQLEVRDMSGTSRGVQWWWSDGKGKRQKGNERKWKDEGVVSGRGF